MKVTIKSLDEISLIASVLRTVSTMHEGWLKPREVKFYERNLRERVSREGLGVLTITLPRLGKCLDKALSSTSPMVYEGFESYLDCKGQSHSFPKFLGELFRRVLDQSGTVLPDPCVVSVKYLRQILYMFYKYDLPYSDALNAGVIARFIETENEVQKYNEQFASYWCCKSQCGFYSVSSSANCCKARGPVSEEVILPEWALGVEHLKTPHRCQRFLHPGFPESITRIIEGAQKLLWRLLKDVNLYDIKPKHGPGSVATGEVAGEKYVFEAVPNKLASAYPIDEYFYASYGHVVDSVGSGGLDKPTLTDEEPYAKVVLVPKDSRGPRLISEEPLVYQWIQQGIRRVLYHHVESHPLTKWNVFFTNQQPNQFGALLGSKTGQYATLDLKDASDRVGLQLVRVLFPGNVLRYFEASRSIGTTLPSGEKLMLQKFAPMGSALCFPVMALTIWSLLTAAAADTDTRESILVYGDDVIVPTAFAAYAIEVLEAFGLKANADKCCMSGLFRESCGVDAFKGLNVTPLRIRKLIPSPRSLPKQLRARPEVYLSWLAYANWFYVHGYWEAYREVTQHLVKVYGCIPVEDQLSYKTEGLTLPYLPDRCKHPSRWNPHLQRWEILTWGVAASSITQHINGWNRLLRFFTEWSPVPLFGVKDDETAAIAEAIARRHPESNPGKSDWSSATYTLRRRTKLVRRWRSCTAALLP